MTEPTTHTPGPWQLCQANNGTCRCGFIWSVPADCVIAQVVSREHKEITQGEGVSQEQKLINGRLIAAAPELAEALRDLHNFAELSTHGGYADESRAAFQKAAELLKRVGL